MTTYLFVTKQEFTPEHVEDGDASHWWSCSSTTRSEDRALVYVTGTGIQYEWRATSNAEPHKEWKYICHVEHVQTFEPPISIGEIREATTKDEWAPPFQNFRGLRSITVPENTAVRILALRTQFDDAKVNAPKESLDNSILLEGSTRQTIETTYERNPEARRRCIAHFGTTCTVCGMDFETVYGPLAKGLIHVHHLNPISEIGSEYEIDPISDMRPVCPNCHSVIHLGGDTRSVEEVKELLVMQHLRTSKRMGAAVASEFRNQL